MTHYDNQGRRVLSGNPPTLEAEARALRAENERLQKAFERIRDEAERSFDDYTSLMCFYWFVSKQTRAALQGDKT